MLVYRQSWLVKTLNEFPNLYNQTNGAAKVMITPFHLGPLQALKPYTMYTVQELERYCDNFVFEEAHVVVEWVF